MRMRTRFMTVLGVALGIMVTGCAHLPGSGAVSTSSISTRAATKTLQLGDLPDGFQLAIDSAPDDAQLAQQLGASASATMLAHLGRRAGTYRAFVYTMAEPSTINGPTQATVEVDVFDMPSHAQAWLTQRQTALAMYGPVVAVGVPGQRHFTRMTVQHGESIAMTRSVLAFTEQNVYVEITSVLLGPGPSLAEDERYADLIDTRILHG